MNSARWNCNVDHRSGSNTNWVRDPARSIPAITPEFAIVSFKFDNLCNMLVVCVPADKRPTTHFQYLSSVTKIMYVLMKSYLWHRTYSVKCVVRAVHLLAATASEMNEKQKINHEKNECWRADKVNTQHLAVVQHMQSMHFHILSHHFHA